MSMQDDDFMQLALQAADEAGLHGEVPVGAVVVKDGVVLATGRNAVIGLHDASAHAEVMALRAAGQVLGNYRLPGCDVFVTLEPCAMCAAAMIHARVRRVVYGASDPKTGAAGGLLNVFNTSFNHQTQVSGGVLAQACSAQLKQFFQGKRCSSI